MAEPTEVITATPGTTALEPVVIGTCADCGQPINSGEGVTIAADGERYHPECRAAQLRKITGAKAKGATG